MLFRHTKCVQSTCNAIIMRIRTMLMTEIVVNGSYHIIIHLSIRSGSKQYLLFDYSSGHYRIYVHNVCMQQHLVDDRIQGTHCTNPTVVYNIKMLIIIEMVETAVGITQRLQIR